uniref:Small ribosomal subunit protein mS31 n=1 Tax=Timema douglasi TaxID=61478 RepID=A0A7R8VSA7_TIMDO|nr:unnamed protein product [Timema douglasi]
MQFGIDEGKFSRPSSTVDKHSPERARLSIRRKVVMVGCVMISGPQCLHENGRGRLRRIGSHFKSQCVVSQVCKVSTSSHCLEKHNDDSESSDEEKEKPKKQPGKNMDAINKLNSLLKAMMEEESSPSKSFGASNIEIAQPRTKNKKILESKDKSKEEVKKVLSESEKLDEALTSAAHDVATSFGGDVKQTESELLHKLLSHSESKPSDVKETTKPSVSLNELIVGMKIDRTKRSDAIPDENRAGQVRRILGTRFQSPSRERFSGEIPYETTLGEKTQEQRRSKMYVYC